MRNFLLFILISASNTLFACVFYPEGEDTRICLFNPEIFGYDTYSEFYFSSVSFSSTYFEDNGFSVDRQEPNIQLWSTYCGGKVDKGSIISAVYELGPEELNERSKNAMIHYLFEQKDTDALDYLRFAKSCESLNSLDDDPWEREMTAILPMRAEQMNKAIELAKTVSNEQLKRRYTFLAIRLAWYNRQFDDVKKLFSSEFENSTTKDILYYWSLYFKSFTDDNNALANYELAQVFANAFDKRFVCHLHYSKKVPIENALKFAKTNQERANVYILDGIERHDKVLTYLQKVYEYSPSSDGLSFLLLREMNKIEDFVFTPYYTLFQSSLSDDRSELYDTTAIATILQRSERDRNYAREVLRFINSVDMNKVDNPILWKSCKAYLLFITREYDACLTQINQLEMGTLTAEMAYQLKIIKSLTLVSSQKKGHAIIPNEVQSTLLSNKNNWQFIFAIGRELEYLGNTTDAALLFSRRSMGEWWASNGADDSFVFWNAKRKTRHLFYDCFSNYFDYVDVVYTPEQTEEFIADVVRNSGNTDSFSVFMYEGLQAELPLLYDLLGTKFIRRNKLDKALLAFESCGNKYWSRAYTSWDNESNAFDKNPFSQIKYTPDFITLPDTFRLNKMTITKQLIYYLQRAEDKNEADRDLYYFLVANAYYNMGLHGNSWMMRRFYWSTDYNSGIEDEDEYCQSNLAKQYYLLALNHAQTEKFKALCLRMATRCERYRLESIDSDLQYRNRDEFMLRLESNKYYLDLEENYGQYSEDLLSGCENFKGYFEARR